MDAARHVDPQGVIDDLVAQTARQAKALHDLHAALEEARQQLQRLQTPKRSVEDVNRLFQDSALEPF